MPTAAERLNERFLSDPLGVLMRVFTAFDDPDSSYLPCSTGWCSSYSDRLSSSLVNANNSNLYSDNAGGLILNMTPMLYCGLSRKKSLSKGMLMISVLPPAASAQTAGSLSQ